MEGVFYFLPLTVFIIASIARYAVSCSGSYLSGIIITTYRTINSCSHQSIIAHLSQAKNWFKFGGDIEVSNHPMLQRSTIGYISILAHFLRLHSPCVGLTFSRQSDPPLEIGKRWSICKPFSHPGMPALRGDIKSISLPHR